MTKRTKAEPVGGYNADHSLTIDQQHKETGAQAVARKLLDPEMRNSHSASSFAGKVLGKNVEAPGQMDYLTHVLKAAEKAADGDLTMVSRMLAAQAITLDAMFTDLASRTALNVGEYVNAAERYGRLALKAQSNCRSTLDALAKLHQPREQTVRHVHVNEGGQAIVADQFHHHAGGVENGKSIKQSHATGSNGIDPGPLRAEVTELPSPEQIDERSILSQGNLAQSRREK